MTEYKDYGFASDAPAHTFNYLTAPIMALLGNDKQQTILDVGCGNGYLAGYLISRGFNAYGTDASEEGIAIAKRTHPTRFYLQDISSGKLPPDLSTIKFDTIVSTEVIEHLYDPEGFIHFCKQILEPSGQIIISTPYHGYLKNLVLSIFNKWDSHMDPLWHGGHIKMWSRKKLSEVLKKAGFSVVAFKGCGRFPYFWKSMVIKAVLN
ncbi:class I SAM-dependent methyltransferase [Mucilaginibacter auburnensis]|uniref:Methyltransferase family protein n=1 Tax=Mucilaginibacter auburnensis TaxID=1457233 RepID=A0A2H9VMD1_9SPHI|nr:class I SAM-dependent methyltransferase [Mucilaginibacter auburnensis]PJJ79465.1 methyltransferase family protein [Mucilaginibacter auburnensis]